MYPLLAASNIMLVQNFQVATYFLNLECLLLINNNSCNKTNHLLDLSEETTPEGDGIFNKCLTEIKSRQRNSNYIYITE